MKLKKIPLSEITQFISRGISPKYDKSGYAVINQRCVRNHQIDFSLIRFSNFKKTRIVKDKYLQRWDVLVNSTGVGTLGRVSQIKRPVNNTTVDSHVTIVRPDLEIFDGKYFGYALIDVECIIKTLGEGATNQTELSKGRLGEVEIKVPSFQTQQKIASILSAYDDLIENNLRRIQLLEEMAQNIYREWFVKFKFPGHEKVRMVDSELGKIPEGWEIGRLKDVASVNEKSINKKNIPSIIHYIDIKSVSTGRINHVKDLLFSEAPGRARRIIRSGDIIWATVRPNLRAYALILEPEVNTVASTGFAVITPRGLPYTYLYCYLTTDSFVEYLVNHTTGSAYPAVNQDDFKNAAILSPDETIMKSFHNITDPFHFQVHALLKKNNNLRQTRDLLLPKLISGEIDVSEMDINIPEEAEV